MVFQVMVLHCKATLGHGQPGLMRLDVWISWLLTLIYSLTRWLSKQNNEWCFGPWFCIIRLYCVMDRQPELIRWILLSHVLSPGSIAVPVDLQSSTLPLCYGCPLTITTMKNRYLHSSNFKRTENLARQTAWTERTGQSFKFQSRK